MHHRVACCIVIVRHQRIEQPVGLFHRCGLCNCGRECKLKHERITVSVCKSKRKWRVLGLCSWLAVIKRRTYVMRLYQSLLSTVVHFLGVQHHFGFSVAISPHITISARFCQPRVVAVKRTLCIPELS